MIGVTGNDWHGDELEAELEKAAAEDLQRAAEFFQTQHKIRLSVESPHVSRQRKRNTAGGPKGSSYMVYTDPARRGQYPKLRTGHGRAGVVRQPVNVPGTIAAGLRVRVGMTANVPYMLSLELRGWRGLLDTLQATDAQLSKILGGRGGASLGGE